MKYYNNGSGFSVRCSKQDVQHFNRLWPCSSLPTRSITFGFDTQGNLVDIWPLNGIDGPEAVALSNDAYTFGLNRRPHV